MQLCMKEQWVSEKGQHVVQAPRMKGLLLWRDDIIFYKQLVHFRLKLETFLLLIANYFNLVMSIKKKHQFPSPQYQESFHLMQISCKRALSTIQDLPGKSVVLGEHAQNNGNLLGKFAAT